MVIHTTHVVFVSSSGFTSKWFLYSIWWNPKSIRNQIRWCCCCLSITTGAFCLLINGDKGSSPNYWFAKGRGNGINKYIIHLEWNGWCRKFRDDFGDNNEYPAVKGCVDRSVGPFGTTLHSKKYISFGHHTYLGRYKPLNPIMYNWNKIYAQYCDGTSYCKLVCKVLLLIW